MNAAALLAITVPAAFAAGAVEGQDYPNKPIHLFAAPAGGGGDFAARVVAQGIAGLLGQSVVVDNRPTVLGRELGAKASPDGYTLTVAGGGLWILPLLQKAPYEVTDFAPISQITREISILAVHPSLPVKSVKELITLATAKPGELNYSMVPSGNANQLAGELFKSMAGLNIVSVPYKGSAPTVTALIGGEVQLTMADPSLILPHAKSGKLRALAVTSAKPSALAPGLPTIAASGLPNYEMVGMTAMFAPAKTRPAIINQLNKETVRVLNLPDVKERLLKGGVEAAPSSPEELAATIKSQTVALGKMIKELGLKVD